MAFAISPRSRLVEPAQRWAIPFRSFPVTFFYSTCERLSRKANKAESGKKVGISDMSFYSQLAYLLKQARTFICVRVGARKYSRLARRYYEAAGVLK